MAVNVYTDDVEVVNGSSLDTPATDNYSLYGNEAGKSIRVPINNLETVFINNNRCFSNRQVELEKVDSGVSIDMTSCLNGDVLIANHSIETIDIIGVKSSHVIMLFESAVDGSIAIMSEEASVFCNGNEVTTGNVYMADIICCSMEGDSKVYIRIFEMTEIN